jgi:hypothetical protein
LIPDVFQYHVLPSHDDTEADTAAAVDEDDDLDLNDDDGSEFDDRLTKLSTPLWVLPLYSLLSSDRQNQVPISPISVSSEKVFHQVLYPL